MNGSIQAIWAKLSPSISRKKALDIAREVSALPLQAFAITRKKPSNFNIYGLPEDEPCWYVTVLNEGSPAIQSSRVVVISRRTGKVLYNGTALDEG